MVVGELAQRCDVAVIGAGPGGYVAALAAARHGKLVTLIERDAVGGTCLNVGCIPSKALLHAAHIAYAARSSAQLGIDATVVVDLSRTRAWMESVVEKLTGGVTHLLRSAGVAVVTGSARFASTERIAIERDGEVSYVEFDHAIIASGSRPTSLPSLPIDGRRIMDSTGALALTTLPASIVIVGGGYIGVELGTAFAKLGSKVTIVEATNQLLPGFDQALVRPVLQALQRLGATVLLSTTVEGDDGHAVLLRQGVSASTRTADIVVVAVGRVANTDGLGLDVVGVTPRADGRLDVDKARRVTRRILAIGDVTDGPALAHKAMAEALVAADTVAGHLAAFDPVAIASIVFSDPELISVGLSHTAAQAAGRDATAFRFPLSANGRSLLLDGRGFVELVSDTATDSVIGAHAVGPGVAELAGEMALAIEMAASAQDVALTIHAHPTMSEAVGEAAHGLLGAPIHVMRR